MADRTQHGQPPDVGAPGQHHARLVAGDQRAAASGPQPVEQAVAAVNVHIGLQKGGQQVGAADLSGGQVGHRQSDVAVQCVAQRGVHSRHLLA